MKIKGFKEDVITSNTKKITSKQTSTLQTFDSSNQTILESELSVKIILMVFLIMKRVNLLNG